MKSKYILMTFALMALLALEACKKEASTEKLYSIFKESVIAEQRDSGNVLAIDTVFLNKTTGDNFAGELRGHVNDSVNVIYDLTVKDLGDDVELEWILRK